MVTEKKKLYTVLRDDLYGNGEKDFTEIKVIARTNAEVKKAYNSKDYFLQFEQSSGSGDWLGADFKITNRRIATLEEIKTYPDVRELN